MKRALLLFLGAGCVHYDVGDLAPAHVDVLTPPARLADQRLAPGRDPGERWIALSPGPSLALAVQARDRDEAIGAAFGLEVTVRTGVEAETHVHPVRTRHFDPGLALGLNLGLVHLRSPAADGHRNRSYVEAQVSKSWFGGAAGWSLAASGHGPQGTGFCGPLYARVTRHLGRETTVEVGLVAKGEITWFWSR